MNDLSRPAAALTPQSYKSAYKPIWCPGCGDYSVLSSLTKALAKLAVGGTGLRVFLPLVIALSAGANFIARAYSSDPNGTADIIAQAIRHPGFSFVEILSPCVTFRPEQREWKQMARPSPVAPTGD